MRLGSFNFYFDFSLFLSWAPLPPSGGRNKLKFNILEANHKKYDLMRLKRNVKWVFVPVWPDLAKFRHFGTPLTIFGHFKRVHLVYCKILRWFGQILYAIGQIFIKVNGQRLSKYSSYLVTMVRSDASSVTRLAEISPLWQKIKSLWQIFESLYLIWQNVEPTLANLLHYWANFHCCSWPNIEKQSNLLVTLDASATSRLSSFVRISFNFKTRFC